MATRGAIEELTAVGFFLPELITRGLGARDRLTYYVSLLQAAQTYAQAPHPPAPTLRAEREASGISDVMFDRTVAASQATATDVIRIPGAAVIVEQIFLDLHEMLQPLRAAAPTRPELHDRLEIYERRLSEQLSAIPLCEGDQLTSSAIEGLSRRTQNGHDSVHQLALDLQWELNRLSKAVAPESIDGATTYGLAAADKALVKAFMHGVNQTRGLLFARPGPRTSAMRNDDHLFVHNDFGTNGIQVFAADVRELTVTVVYTDMHRARMRFFHDMFLAFDIQWEPSSAAAGANGERIVGRFVAEDQACLERFLTFVGSRLVFVIDWNRARKRLARFVKNAEAVALLKWAADNNVGHHAFLQAGDARLVYTALERVLPSHVRFGGRLDELLGADVARLFLTSVLGIITAGVSTGRSSRLMENEIEAELLTHLRTTDSTALGAAADHAAVLSTIAERLRQALAHLAHGEGYDERHIVAGAVTGLEVQADEIVRRSSRLLDQTGDGHHLRRLLGEADDAADQLEETAFLLTLFPVKRHPEGMALLEGLADLVSRSAREYVRCLDDARGLTRAPARQAIERFLVTIDQLEEFRRQASSAERTIRTSLLDGTADYRELYVSSEMARGFELVAHTLARCGVIVRDHVLNATSGLTNMS